MKKLSVKLIHCANINIANPDDREEKNTFFMPMGLFPLAKVLKDNNFDSEIIHMDLEEGKDIQQILDFQNIDAIGFDCHWVNQSAVVFDTIELIKKIKPEIFIFLGGFTASLFCEEIIEKFSYIDAVIRGYGEVPVVKLCNALYEHKINNPGKINFNFKNLKDVPNLIWRNNNIIVKNNFSYIGSVEELERLDFVSVELLRNWKSYRMLSRFWTRFSPIDSSPYFLVEVGRGCVYSCLFCGGNCLAQYKINNRKGVIVRSIDSVIDTIKKAISRGFETFYTSFEFEGSDDWYIALFKKLKKINLKINYVHGSWALPSKNFINAVSEACNEVIFEISPETADLSLRKKNKDSRLYYTNVEMEECLDYIRTKKNIKVQLYFGYFLVNDTKKTVFDTMKYCLELILKYPDLLENEYFNFSTDPGSLLFFNPEKYNVDIKVRNFQDYLKYIKEIYQVKKSKDPDMRVFKPKSLTDKETFELDCKLNIFNCLFSYFRKSISYLLDIIVDPFVVVDFLYHKKIDNFFKTTFTYDEIRQILFDICASGKIINEKLIFLINHEYNENYKHRKSYKVTPQIWFDDSYKEILKNYKENEAERFEIKEKEINIDFIL